MERKNVCMVCDEENVTEPHRHDVKVVTASGREMELKDAIVQPICIVTTGIVE